MLTKDDVAQYVELDNQRKKLARQVDAIERQQKGLGEKIREYVRAHGGSDRTTLFQGFILALKWMAGSVAWKTAFVEVAGNAAAEKLIAKAPPRESLSVTEAADG